MPIKRRKAKKSAPDPTNERFISSIHHYCDRWCERCVFSHRCLKFVLAEHLCGLETAAREGATQTVFDALSRVLDEARRELEKAAGKLGMELDEDAVRASIAVEKRLQRQAMRTGARESKAALTYAHMTDEWFNNELKVPLKHVRDMERRVRQGTLSVARAKGDLVRLNDCVEVIRWHQHLIYVKLCRAFSSRVEEEGATERYRDSDGSAKVALLSLDASILAWGVLREMFPEKTDSVLEILVHLDRLRRAVQAKFPRARRFKRPGFDDRTPRKLGKPSA
jgi:hypothetical protein